MWIVISGSLLDGFEFIGPFDCYSDAISWAESDDYTNDWWIRELKRP